MPLCKPIVTVRYKLDDPKVWLIKHTVMDILDPDFYDLTRMLGILYVLAFTQFESIKQILIKFNMLITYLDRIIYLFHKTEIFLRDSG